MKYTDKKAQEIAHCWAIAPSTIRTWRRRGNIPDEYLEAPISLLKALNRIDGEEWRAFKSTISQLGDEARNDFGRYLFTTKVPENIDRKDLFMRLYSKRTHLRRKSRASSPNWDLGR